MGAAENKQLLRDIFSELSKGNSRPFVESMADDFRWTVTGTTPWSKTYDGKQAVVTELLGQLRSRFDGPVRVAASRFVAEDDLVVVEARGAGNVTTAGTPYNNTYCFVFLVEDGKLREVTEYMDTALVVSALGGPAT
jgi:ketosteroid isomerase-like protein